MNPSLALIPIILIWISFGLVYIAAQKREQKVPIDDIGTIFMLILVFYSTLPPLLWVFQGGEYSSIFNERLLTIQPSSDDVLTLLLIGLGYAVGFTTIYLNYQIRIPLQNKLSIIFIDNSLLSASIIIVIISLSFGLYLTFSNTIQSADSYIDQYRVVAELPLLLRQIIKIVSGVAAIAKIVIMIALFQRWPKYKMWFYVYIGSVLLAFDAEGSRAAIATGLFAILIGWHVLISTIPFVRFFLIGLLGFILFLILGIFRAVGSWIDLLSLDFRDFSLGEFDSIWANGIEILQETRNGAVTIPLQTLLGEFYAFIPSQLLPFEKSTFTEWYLITFHAEYKELGGGWVFGAIPQAVAGGGVFDALARGAVLGGLAVWLMCWYRSSKALWWYFPTYLFLLINVFQSIRDTTFRLFGDFIQLVVPAIILISFFGGFFKNKLHK